jgi:hypothetical protein
MELCRPQAEREPGLRLGEYKTADNCTTKSDGTIHRYARASDTGTELEHLVEVMRSDDFTHAHPSLQAAYVHLGLAAIHPFADGNGRVARAVGSALLQSKTGMPLIIYADQRNQYLTALERADGRDYGPFARFIFDRCLDSMRFVADRVAALAAPGSEEFERLYQAHAGMTYQEVTNLAIRVADELTNDFNQAWGARRLPANISGAAGRQQRGGGEPLGNAFRGTDVNATIGTFLSLSSPPPAAATVQISFGIFIARDITARFPLVIANWDLPGDRLDIRLDDVVPANTTDYVIRRRAWVDRKLSEAIARLYELGKVSRGS